ncbi:MAG TPA: carotenoid biosynthesis protein [Candidatus Acidoferrum sp.]|nr:carotenoid biosynthesis protein [Candidatus Acidoferrum sp.]
MENPPEESPAVLENKRAIVFHRLLAFLLAAAAALEIVSFFRPLPFAGQQDTALILLAAVSTLVSLWRQLPLQNVLLAAFGIIVMGGGLSALGARTNLPFGPFTFASGLGPVFYNALPWTMPLIWVIVVFNSRGVARLILRPWRKNKTYGYRVIGLTAILVLLFDVALDPFASRIKHFWLWSPTALKLTWEGAPLVNFFTWAAVTLLILLVVTPALIVKKPRGRSVRHYHPLGVWLGGLIIFGTGCAVNGIWPPFFADAAMGLAVAIFSIRGAMW